MAAYLGSFDPANPNKCLNYFGDAGNFADAGATLAFSIDVASNAVFVVNTIGASYGSYKLTVTGGDCDNILPHPSFAVFDAADSRTPRTRIMPTSGCGTPCASIASFTAGRPRNA